MAALVRKSIEVAIKMFIFLCEYAQKYCCFSSLPHSHAQQADLPDQPHTKRIIKAKKKKKMFTLRVY